MDNGENMFEEYMKVIEAKKNISEIKKNFGFLIESEIGKISMNDIRRLLDPYFGVINAYVQLINVDTNISFLLESDFEQWLLGDEDIFSSSSLDRHPIYVINDISNKWAEDRLKGVTNEQEYVIAMEIVNSKFANRGKINFRYRGNDYKIKTDGQSEYIIPFENYGSLTGIQDIRLIEKIKRVQKKLGRKDIKIAYLGALMKDSQKFNKYFQGSIIDLDYFRPCEENMFFECEKNEMRLNLLDNASLIELLRTYDMVLFLDESYFYQKAQSKKSKREEEHAVYVNWYWEKSQKDVNSIWDILNVYYNMYEEARAFLSDRHSVMSARYEFDVRLLKRLEAIADKYKSECAVIYLYINYPKIADKSITELNICKDEYYDGKKLIVYRIDENKVQDSFDYVNLPEESVFVSIELWKFIKSISNTYYNSDLWMDCEIMDLKNVKVIFFDGHIMEEDGDSLKLKYYVCYAGENSRIQEKTKAFLQGFFSAITNKDELDCVRFYLKRLVSEAVLSRSDSVEAVLLSYFILKKKKITFEASDFNMSVDEIEKQTKEKQRPYKMLKTVYSIIERLDTIIIRDMDRLRTALLFERSNSLFEDSDIVFFECLKKIHNACERIGDRVSRIHLYSGVNEG